MNKFGKIFLGIIITLIILMLSGPLGSTLAMIMDILPSGFFIQFVIFLFSSIVIYIFNKRGIIEFKIKKISLSKLLPPILFVVIFLTFIQLIFTIVFGSLDEHQGNMPVLSISQQFFIIVIFASLSEELLFRGFLQNMLAPIQAFGINILKIRLSLPVIISGILFGLIHFAILSFGASFLYTITVVISAMILGMIAGFFQEKNDNFLYAPIIHATANLSGLILSIVL